MPVSFSLVPASRSRGSVKNKLNQNVFQKVKIINLLFFTFFLLLFSLTVFTVELHVLSLILFAVLAVFLAYNLFYSESGKVQLFENYILIQPKNGSSEKYKLDKSTDIHIYTLSNDEFFRPFIKLLFTIKSGFNEHSFGMMIRSKEQKKQYIQTLDSWYRNGYAVKELNEIGSRVFKLTQGLNYADIQKIKNEYGIEWN